MKKFLLSAFAMLLALTAGAQNFTVEKSLNPQGVQAPAFGAFKAPAKANLAANQRLVGYFDTDDCDNYVGVPRFTGSNKVAIELTADDLAPYYGKKIAGVRFNLGQGETSTGVFVQNLTLENGQIVDMADVATSDKSVTSAAGATNTGEWHEVMFDNKVELSSSFQELFVGFNYKQTSSNYPIGVNSKVDGPFFMYANIPSSQGGKGAAWYQFQSGGMGLAIQLIVEGEFGQNNVQPLDFGNVMVAKGKTKNVAVKFRNLGSKFTSIDYTISLDGKAGAEQHLDFGKDYGVAGTHTIEVPFAAASELGKNAVTLTVTKVNGAENACAIKTATGTLYTVEKEFVKRSVVEQYTGTTCGFCPMGHVAMHNMQELYGDQFVGIAMHQYDPYDPMYNDFYNLGFEGAPSCKVNRNGAAMNPYSDMPKAFKASLEEMPLVDVTVEGAFSEDTAYVYAKASVESMISGDYEIAYMLIADNLSGTTSKWKQHNYLTQGARNNPYKSKSSMPEDLQFLWDEPSSYAATYNDVLIASSYVSSKNKATLPSLVANGTVNSYYTLTMPTKKALKNTIRSCGNEVYVIAMVLDKKTGAIVNARKAKVADFGTTGIENVNNSSEATVVARYNVNGVQIAAPVKGINIVKMSDGTTHKVLVK